MKEIVVELKEEEIYDPNEARKEFVRRMEKEGYEVLLPAEDELFIDIDSAEQREIFERNFGILKNNWRKEFNGPIPTMESSKPSKSGWPCCHVVVKVPFPLVSDFHRIAWQGALGSDPIRELLSLIRCLNGDEHPTLFVEKKGG